MRVSVFIIKLDLYSYLLDWLIGRFKTHACKTEHQLRHAVSSQEMKALIIVVVAFYTGYCVKFEVQHCPHFQAHLKGTYEKRKLGKVGEKMAIENKGL